MSKRPRQSSNSSPRPASRPAAKADATVPPAAKADATVPPAAKVEPKDASGPAKPAKAKPPAKSTKKGVSARAVQKAAQERLSEETAAASPAPAPIGRVRKAVETVLAYAEKLGEEVLERVTGEAEPVPASAYLAARAPLAGAEPVPVSAWTSPPPPVPEDTSASAGSSPPPPVEVVATAPADAQDIDREPAPDRLSYADPDALAARSAPVPAAYLAAPEPVRSPVIYLADLEPDAREQADRDPPGHPAMTEFDEHLMAEGTHLRLFEKLGAQLLPGQGVHFAVWAPNARSVSVIGEFNGWDPARDRLQRNGSGVWGGVVPAAAPGMFYKYRVVGMRGEELDKADPCAQATELPPQTASRIADTTYAWSDEAWLRTRAARQSMRAPMSVYEVHLGSWMRGPQGEFLGYREVAPRLIEHVRALGFTHVEFLPLTEHPFYGSWGYQASAYFAPSARFGAPQDLMYLIDQLHQAEIGVLLDWVPAHFPADAHGLARFDGTCLYEHHDRRRGLHPDWKTLIFNLSRPEVRSFLLSSAMLWLERYHIDGIRVDAVASMLYLDYSRGPGQWLPNEHGGRENLESVAFLRELNRVVHQRHPDVLTIAEDSTAWPGVTAPVERGGLGFDLKWDMGWMHDTLRYLGRDPLGRPHHHDELTFRMMYVYNERFMLPLSHDEVVHGKGSLVRKMHGDAAHKFASLRLLYAYMFTAPGQKLLFMGDEFAQLREWNHDRALDWALRQLPQHAGLERWVQRVAHLYRDEPGLHELDHEPAGFEWLIVDDRMRSLVVYLRLPSVGPTILVALNFTPVTWTDQRIGLPAAGRWTLLARSDASEYSDDPGQVSIDLPEHFESQHDPTHARPDALTMTVPASTAVLLRGPDAAVLRAAAQRARAERIAREVAAAAQAEAERIAREVAAAAQAEAERAAAEPALQADRESERAGPRTEDAAGAASDAADANGNSPSTGEL